MRSQGQEYGGCPCTGEARESKLLKEGLRALKDRRVFCQEQTVWILEVPHCGKVFSPCCKGLLSWRSRGRHSGQ